MNTKLPNALPSKKDAYDWREKVCKSCGVSAMNGCCPLHAMNCGFCQGFGAVSKEQWEAHRDTRIGTRKLSDPSSRKMDDLKTWICNQIDDMEWHGCNSCWSDDHNCTCAAEKAQKSADFLRELKERMPY